MSCPGDKALVSKVMLTVGVYEGRRVGGGAEGLEGELGFHPRGNLQSKLTQGRETRAHISRSGAVGHKLTPFLHPCQAAQQKLRQASTNVKHWNVQMNRLMHPIGPGGRRPAEPADHPSLDLLRAGHEPRPPPTFPFWGESGGRKDSQRRYHNASCKKRRHKPFFS